jgi:predicted ATP-dependent endonuclease of OLD family
MVIYGENGSGKSSIFRAFELFFAASDDNSLHIDTYKNIFIEELQQNSSTNNLVEICLKFSQPLSADLSSQVYKWNNEGESPYRPEIRQYKRSIGLLDYHKLLRMHYWPQYSENDRVDVWEVLQHSILANVVNPESHNTFAVDFMLIQRIANLPRIPTAKREELQMMLKIYEFGFVTIIDRITKEANRLLLSFFPDYNTQLEFVLDDFQMPNILDSRRIPIIKPSLYLRVNYYDKPINEFHSFLNEARLTAITLSLYFAALLIAPLDNFKLLVLDDVLLGIDLNNRLIVLDILKSNDFKSWQVYLLTHDHTWFTMIRQHTINWRSYELYQGTTLGIPTPILKPSKDALDKAKQYLGEHEYAVAGFYARNALEEIIKNLAIELANDANFKISVKPKKGAIYIDLEEYINSIKSYYNKSKNKNQNASEIVDCLEQVQNFKNILLNRLVHDTERVVFASEIQKTVNSIEKLQKLLKANST